MKLVIAEKPSVAQSIAGVIGADEKKDGYLEGNGYLVSWCVGHLVEPAAPEGYSERFRKWRHETLPIIPEEWKYEVKPEVRAQFVVLKKLLNRTDVDKTINACDAGREGELIFRLVCEAAGCRKPMERLWISSMEESAVRLPVPGGSVQTTGGLAGRNQRHEAFYRTVRRQDFEGGQGADTHPCDDRRTGGDDCMFSERDLLYGTDQMRGAGGSNKED